MLYAFLYKVSNISRGDSHVYVLSKYNHKSFGWTFLVYFSLFLAAILSFSAGLKNVRQASPRDFINQDIYKIGRINIRAITTFSKATCRYEQWVLEVIYVIQ